MFVYQVNIAASTASRRAKRYGDAIKIPSLISQAQITVQIHRVNFIGVGIIHPDSVGYLCSEQVKVHIACRWRGRNETYNNNLTAFRRFFLSVSPPSRLLLPSSVVFSIQCYDLAAAARLPGCVNVGICGTPNGIDEKKNPLMVSFMATTQTTIRNTK